MMRLAGKIAFITGAADGQGRAAAELFASEGAVVVGCDLKDEALRDTQQHIHSKGGRMIASSPVDLGDPDAAASWISEGVRQAGGIDILYNNAAAVRFGTIAETPLEDWSFTIRNELDLIFHTTRAAWPYLVDRGAGSILNTASVSALKGTQGLGAGAHAAAKGGLVSLTRQLAAEGAVHRIRANAISPGFILTPATEWLARRTNEIVANIPLGRAGTPRDVAYCALYLASDEASWVTGANFVIDGGASAMR